MSAMSATLTFPCTRFAERFFLKCRRLGDVVRFLRTADTHGGEPDLTGREARRCGSGERSRSLLDVTRFGDFDLAPCDIFIVLLLPDVAALWQLRKRTHD